MNGKKNPYSAYSEKVIKISLVTFSSMLDTFQSLVKIYCSLSEHHDQNYLTF